MAKKLLLKRSLKKTIKPDTSAKLPEIEIPIISLPGDFTSFHVERRPDGTGADTYWNDSLFKVSISAKSYRMQHNGYGDTILDAIADLKEMPAMSDLEFAKLQISAKPKEDKNDRRPKTGKTGIKRRTGSR